MDGLRLAGPPDSIRRTDDVRNTGRSVGPKGCECPLYRDGEVALACEVVGTARCSLSHPILRSRTAQPARRFATTVESPCERCSTTSSARTWPRFLLKPSIAIPAAICWPSPPRNFRATCRAASSVMASPASAVARTATICWSPSPARTVECVLPAAHGARPIPRRIFGTAFFHRFPCKNGSSRCRGSLRNNALAENHTGTGGR